VATRTAILTALRDGPRSTPQIVHAVGDTRPNQRALAGAGEQLRRMEEKGYVRRAGEVPGVYQRGPAQIWEITDAGRQWRDARVALDRVERLGGVR
jgi:DNA-binding PadR family transcriptional regulator